MTQRKPVRHPRRGSEKRRRPCQVAVRLTEAEDAALAELGRRTGTSKPDLLRESFLSALDDGACPPSAAQVRMWIRAHGWTEEPPGPGGSIWHKDAARVGVIVPRAESDERATWGAVERIAKAERMTAGDLAVEMLAISEEESGQ